MVFCAVYTRANVRNCYAESLSDVRVTHVFKEQRYDLAIRHRECANCFHQPAKLFAGNQVLFGRVLTRGQVFCQELRLPSIRMPDDVIDTAVMGDAKDEWAQLC